MSRGVLLRFLAFGFLSFAAAGLGDLFTARGLGAWYDGLAKPSWTPPGPVIGAVWTVLFALLAIASALRRNVAQAAPRVAMARSIPANTRR